MTDKRMLPVVIIDLLGIIIGIAANVYAALAGDLEILRYAHLWVNVAALVSAFIYLIMGYKKNAAVFYKIFASLFALSQFVAVLTIAENREDYFGISCYTVLFALILMMALVQDMGKKKTFIICALILITGILLLVINFFKAPAGIQDTGNWIFRIVSGFSVVVMSAVMWLMANAKFMDKEARKGYSE